MLNYATTPDCFNPAMEGGHQHQYILGDTVTVLWTPGEIDFHLHSPRPSSSGASGGVAWRVKHPLGCTADFLPPTRRTRARTRVAPILETRGCAGDTWPWPVQGLCLRRCPRWNLILSNRVIPPPPRPQQPGGDLRPRL